MFNWSEANHFRTDGARFALEPKGPRRGRQWRRVDMKNFFSCGLIHAKGSPPPGPNHGPARDTTVPILPVEKPPSLPENSWLCFETLTEPLLENTRSCLQVPESVWCQRNIKNQETCRRWSSTRWWRTNIFCRSRECMTEQPTTEGQTIIVINNHLVKFMRATEWL